MYTKVSIR